MKRKLGDLLIEAGAVTQADLDGALTDQSNGDFNRLGEILVASGRVTPTQLARALAAQHGLPFVDLRQVAPKVAALVPSALQHAHQLVPFKLERLGLKWQLHIAVADPLSTDVIGEIEFSVQKAIVLHIASSDEIASVHRALSGEVDEAALVDDELTSPIVGTVLEGHPPAPAARSLRDFGPATVAIAAPTARPSAVKSPALSRTLAAQPGTASSQEQGGAASSRAPEPTPRKPVEPRPSRPLAAEPRAPEPSAFEARTVEVSPLDARSRPLDARLDFVPRELALVEPKASGPRPSESGLQPKAAGAKPGKPGPSKPLASRGSDAKTADANPEAPRPDDPKSANARAFETKPSDRKPFEVRPSGAKSSEAKSSNSKPFDAKTADGKPFDAKTAEAKPAGAKISDPKVSEAKPLELGALDARALKPPDRKVAERLSGGGTSAATPSPTKSALPPSDAAQTSLPPTQPRLSTEPTILENRPSTTRQVQGPSAAPDATLPYGTAPAPSAPLEIQAGSARPTASLPPAREAQAKTEPGRPDPLAAIAIPPPAPAHRSIAKVALARVEAPLMAAPAVDLALPAWLLGGSDANSGEHPAVSAPSSSLLSQLDRMATSEAAAYDGGDLKPARLLAATVRALIERGVLAEIDLLDALGKK